MPFAGFFVLFSLLVLLYVVCFCFSMGNKLTQIKTTTIPLSREASTVFFHPQFNFYAKLNCEPNRTEWNEIVVVAPTFYYLNRRLARETCHNHTIVKRKQRQIIHIKKEAEQKGEKKTKINRNRNMIMERKYEYNDVKRNRNDEEYL